MRFVKKCTSAYEMLGRIQVGKQPADGFRFRGQVRGAPTKPGKKTVSRLRDYLRDCRTTRNAG